MTQENRNNRALRLRPALQVTHSATKVRSRGKPREQPEELLAKLLVERQEGLPEDKFKRVPREGNDFAATSLSWEPTLPDIRA